MMASANQDDNDKSPGDGSSPEHSPPQRRSRSSAGEKPDIEHTRHVVQLRCRPDMLPLGIQPDDDLRVSKIQPNSPMVNRLHVGDRILKVGRSHVGSVKELSRALKHAATTGTLVLIVQRDPDMHPLPADRERNIQRRRHGFAYLLVTVDWQPGSMRLGLTIRHRQNRVLVIKTEPDSLAHATLLECDRIVDVDGQPVSHRDVAKQLIIAALNSRQTVSLLVERPLATEAVNEVRTLMEGANTADAQTEQPAGIEWPDYRAPVDVCKIVEFERTRLQAGGASCQPGKSILRRRPPPLGSHEKTEKTTTTSDNECDVKTAVVQQTPKSSGNRLRRGLRRLSASTAGSVAQTPSKIKIRRRPVEIHIAQDTDPKKPLKKVLRNVKPSGMPNPSLDTTASEK